MKNLEKFERRSIIDSKQMLIDAIVGKGFDTIKQALYYTNVEYAEFTGNSWNESWAWKKNELHRLSIIQLRNIYDSLYIKE